MIENIDGFVWVFNGNSGRFAGGVFLDKETAEVWIRKHDLEGVLTKYPVGVGVYDWAIENDFFTPKKDKERSPEFIAKFTTASQEHYHYERDEEE